MLTEVVNLLVPVTSKVNVGLFVWIPTLERVLMRNAGVAFESVAVVLLFQTLAETPVSTTKVPVV